MVREGNIMDSTTYDDILAYWKTATAAYPSISAEDLKKTLLTQFVGGKDVLTTATTGCACDPIADFLTILSIVFNSLHKVVTQDKGRHQS